MSMIIDPQKQGVREYPAGVCIIEDNDFMTRTESTAKTERIGKPQDLTTSQWMELVEHSGVLDFWNEPEEEVYSLEDGEPA